MYKSKYICAYQVPHTTENMDRLQQLVGMHKEDTTDTFLIFAIAMEYKKRKDLDAAITWLEKLKKEDPSYVGLYYHLGSIYLEVQMLDQALLTFDEGIAVAKKQADFHALSELLNIKNNATLDL